MRISLSSAVAALAVAAALLGPAVAAEIKIGVLVPTTGSEATYGQDMANAVQMAMDEINAAGGGDTYSKVIGDDGCDPQQAVNAATKLVSSGIVGVVGGYCSGATIPTLKIFGDAKLPMVITAANSTKLIPTNPGNAFLINSTGNDQVAKALEVFKAKGVKSLAIVNEGDAYSQDLATLAQKGFTGAGGVVPSFETVNKGEQDFSSVVTKIKASSVDAVFWTAYYADGGPFIKQLREGGYTGLIIVGDGSTSTELFKLAGAEAANGVLALSSPTPDFLPNAKAFADTYKAKYGNAPGPYAALTYDGTKLLASAIKTAGGTNSAKVIDALQKSDFKGLAGEITFRKDHTLARSNFIVLEGKGGAWELAKY